MADLTSSFDNPTSQNPISQGGLFNSGPGTWVDGQTTAGGAFAATAADVYCAAFAATTSPGAAIGSDQYSQTTLGTRASIYGYDGPLCRGQGTGAGQGDCYHLESFFEVVNKMARVYQVDDNGTTITQNQIGADITYTPTSGHVIRIECTGSGPVTIVAIVNGSSSNRDDSSSPYLTGGQPGLWLYANDTATTIASDWGGGDLGAAKTPELYESSSHPLAMWQAFSVCSF